MRILGRSLARPMVLALGATAIWATTWSLEPTRAASAAAPVPAKCRLVAFTPNSGDGAFDIRARYITCATARAKIRAARGEPRALRGWRCRLVRREEVTGAGRYACTSRASVHGTMRTRLIAWTTGN